MSGQYPLKPMAKPRSIAGLRHGENQFRYNFGPAADLAQDLRRVVPSPAMSRQDRLLASSIIIAAGAEAVFQLRGKPRMSTKSLGKFLTNFMMRGLIEWQSGKTKIARPKTLPQDYPRLIEARQELD
ncbi:MAG TPA: hypothetical protein VII95_09430 [Terriglobales bacterium]